MATNDGDDVTLTEPYLRGLGGGRGRFSPLSASSASAGSESFFSKGSFDSDPGPAGISSPKGDLPSDLDLRCVGGRGGAAGFKSEPDRLGAGGTGGVRRLTASEGGRVLISGGGGLAGGSSNFGFAGRGGRGTSTPNRLSLSRLTEEQRTGGIGGGESDWSPASSALKRKEIKRYNLSHLPKKAKTKRQTECKIPGR